MQQQQDGDKRKKRTVFTGTAAVSEASSHLGQVPQLSWTGSGGVLSRPLLTVQLVSSSLFSLLFFPEWRLSAEDGRRQQEVQQEKLL